MNIDEYQDKVIELFKSGNATEKQWNQMAAVVLDASENEPGMVSEIDLVVLKDRVCERCGSIYCVCDAYPDDC